MLKYNINTKQNEYVSRYKLLTKFKNEAGANVTILTHNNKTDMYRCKVQVGKRVFLVWYTDEDVYTFYNQTLNDKIEKKEAKKNKQVKE